MCGIFCVGLAWLSSSAVAAELAGAVQVIDGDTISIGDQRIRL
jgi:endonuclease YncB( thermonuclease family)